MFTTAIWPNPPLAEDYNGEIDYLKTWLRGRIEWVDYNIGEVREKVDYVTLNLETYVEYVAVSAYPNPFIQELTFSLELEQEHHVLIEVYNTIGQKMSTVVNKELAIGKHQIIWDLYSQGSGDIMAGLYYYTVILDNKPVYTGKLLKH
jgi:hypothetical protein